KRLITITFQLHLTKLSTNYMGNIDFVDHVTAHPLQYIKILALIMSLVLRTAFPLFTNLKLTTLTPSISHITNTYHLFVSKFTNLKLTTLTPSISLVCHRFTNLKLTTLTPSISRKFTNLKLTTLTPSISRMEILTSSFFECMSIFHASLITTIHSLR
ncbi:hypothetical protein L9F63_015404, partial [Diploptera punctata]